MGGIASIIAGVGEAMHEERRNKQKMEEARIERIRETLKGISEDEFLPPDEVAKWNNLRVKIDATGKIPKEIEQALPVFMADYQDSLRARSRGAAPQVVPPPPAAGPSMLPPPGLSPLEQPMEVAPPPGAQAAPVLKVEQSPYPAGSRADRKWKSEYSLRTATRRMTEAAEEAKAKREQARSEDLLRRYQRGEITGDQLNILAGERLIIPPPPTAAPRPFVVEGKLVSPEGKVLFEGTPKQEIVIENYANKRTGTTETVALDKKTGKELWSTTKSTPGAPKAGKGGGGTSGLVDAVIAQPAIYDTLTPTARTAITPELHRRGFTGFGKPLTDSSIGKIAESRSAIESVKDLRKTLLENEQYIGPIAGLQALSPYSDARKAQAKIDLVKQRVGKALEGGVLRKEDEEKYKRILATLNDEPATAISKVDNLIATLERDISIFEQEQRRGGRRVGESAGVPPPPGQSAAPIVQQNKKTGEYRHSMDNGKTWLPGRP